MSDWDDWDAPAPVAPKRKPGRPPKARPDAEAAPPRVKRPYNRKPEPVVEKAPSKADDVVLTDGGVEDLPLEDLAPEGRVPDVMLFRRPVTRPWLATPVGREPRRIKEQLGQCPTVGYTKKGDPLYDFMTAVAYLIPPKIDGATWLRSQSTTTLPPLLMKALWEGVRARQLVELQAGDLWRTDQVQDVLGRTALMIKDRVMLWVEALPGKDAMTTAQYETVQREATALLDDIYKQIGDIRNQSTTGSARDELRALDVEAAAGPPAAE